MVLSWNPLGSITVRIEDNLGVSNDLNVSYIACDSEALELPTPNAQFFQVQGSGGLSYAIPLQIFEKAKLLEGGRHLIRVRSGSTFEGVICGSVEDIRKGKKYALSQVNSMKLIRRKPGKLPTPTPATLWSVEYPKDNSGPLHLAFPSLGFRWSGTYKKIDGPFYEMASGTFSGRSTGFRIKVGADTLTANIEDFVTIVLDSRDVPKVTVQGFFHCG